MKSAYELALERMEQQGIERPRTDKLSDETRQQIAEVRQRADAKLAELEILHRDHLSKLEGDPVKLEEANEHYQRDRRRVEDERDRKVAALREG